MAGNSQYVTITKTPANAAARAQSSRKKKNSPTALHLCDWPNDFTFDMGGREIMTKTSRYSLLFASEPKLFLGHCNSVTAEDNLKPQFWNYQFREWPHRSWHFREIQGSGAHKRPSGEPQSEIRTCYSFYPSNRRRSIDRRCDGLAGVKCESDRMQAWQMSRVRFRFWLIVSTRTVRRAYFRLGMQ